MSTELIAVQNAVAEFDKVAAGLAELKKAYGAVVYDVTNGKGMDEAKAARVALREPRYEIERIRKNAKAPILTLGKKLDAEAARITAEILKIEEPIDKQIKAEEARKEAEKQAKIDAELKRVADLQERVAELRGNQSISASSGSALIADHISDLERIPVDGSFEEFQRQAEDAKAAGLSRLRELHVAAVAHEAEQERIKIERAELAKLKAEQAERDAKERARIAEEERVAKAARDAEDARLKAIRDAEAAAQAEELRKQREELARQQREQNELRKAEETRLANERAEIARQQEALRKAQEPKPRVKLSARPSNEEIISVLAAHYKVNHLMIREWLWQMDIENPAISAA